MMRIGILLMALLALPRPASATWSIAAVDARTREVGIAGASCTPDVMAIAGVVPGRGVMAAQGMTNDVARLRGMEMLRAGASPAEIVRAVADSVFDPVHFSRQYGAVALDQPPAAHTGARTMEWAGYELGDDVAVQGSQLAGPRVAGDAMAAFRAAAADTASTLADRLLRALEAGAAAGGDARCPGQTALSAFLVVAGPNDRREARHLHLYVNGQSEHGRDPVELLRERYDEWRRLIRLHAPDGKVSAAADVAHAWDARPAAAVAFGSPRLRWSQRPDLCPRGGGTGLVARFARCL
jgi:uncharacterized Ntn-hydrolase superfamily protein